MDKTSFFTANRFFAAVVAEPLNLILLGPPYSWLPGLPASYRLRDVRYTTLDQARRLSQPAFIKPADDKCFTAKVYESGNLLPAESVLPAETPVLIAEPVQWEVEFRCFLLDRAVVTLSPYLRNGELAQDENGIWTDPRTAEAERFAATVLGDPSITVPPAVVFDVGWIADRGWAVVEANAAWGSGIYGCDPEQVLQVVRRACLRPDQLSESDRAWIVGHG